MEQCKTCDYEFLKDTSDRPLFCCECELSYRKQILWDELKETKIYRPIDKICEIFACIINWITNQISKF